MEEHDDDLKGQYEEEK